MVNMGLFLTLQSHEKARSYNHPLRVHMAVNVISGSFLTNKTRAMETKRPVGSSSSFAADLFGSKESSSLSSKGVFSSIFPPPSSVWGRNSSGSKVLESWPKQPMQGSTYIPIPQVAKLLHHIQFLRMMGEKMTLMETIQWMLLEGTGGKVRFIIRDQLSHAFEFSKEYIKQANKHGRT
ncbi:hypothetical protein V6N12_039545 [Hibiscus sabdariffa]|uniref:Uncharacterized protein n=1 Tax=Hibiscus sabdariffa TaxID=183260 RepID=A0ABR2E0Z7_9ROSI